MGIIDIPNIKYRRGIADIVTKLTSPTLMDIDIKKLKDVNNFSSP